MNREQMVEKATVVLPYHSRLNPPGGECSCGHVTPLGRMTSEHVAQAVLDAILPQVSTVAELEALPVGTVLLSKTGEPWWRDSHPTVPWSGKGGGYGSTHDPLHVVHGWFIDREAPLTVVWQPEVTA